MGGSSNDLAGSGAFENCGGGHQGAAGINHIVEDETVFVLDAGQLVGAGDLAGMLVIA